MKKKLFYLLVFSICFESYSQGKTLLIYDKTPSINIGTKGKAFYLISFKSRDKRFDTNSYKFIISNKDGFETYKPLNKVGKVVALDTLDYLNLKELRAKPPWELHNFLSLKKNIYLIVKKQNVNSENTIFLRYPLIYKGTQKNLEMLKQD